MWPKLNKTKIMHENYESMNLLKLIYPNYMYFIYIIYVGLKMRKAT